MTYDDEQLAAIKSGIWDVTIFAKDYKQRIKYVWSDQLTQREGEQFAIFGPVAYKVFPPQTVDDEDGWTRVEYVPVVIDGRMLGMLPEAGRGGLLTIVRIIRQQNSDIKNPKWQTAFADVGWLNAVELTLPTQGETTE